MIKLFSELYYEPIRKVTNSVEDWQDFLSTAGQNYKYSFNDQLMIYNQKPQATACAEMSVWNKLGRRVKAGSKGIRLYVQNGDTLYKKYVFDISDTYSKNGKNLKLWEMNEAENTDIAKNINKHFNIGNSGDLSSVLMNLSAHFTNEFRVGIEDSIKLEKGINLEKLINSVKNSSAFMTMKRCGFSNVESYFVKGSFDEIIKINTLESLQNIGDFVSTISTLCITEVKTQARNLRQEVQNERLLGDRENISTRNIPEGGKRKSPEKSSTVREIFKDEARLSEGEQSTIDERIADCVYISFSS